MHRGKSEQQQYTAPADMSAQALAMHLRHSLVQIQQVAALESANSSIQSIAETTLHLLDCYALVQPERQLHLELEPVSMGSIIQDVMHQLDPFAKEHNCALRDSYTGASTLVFADRALARGALLAMGHAIIEGATAEDSRTSTVLFGARRSAEGQKIGVFSSGASVSTKHLTSTKKIAGGAQQQCTGITGSGGGILLADTLLRYMNSHVQASSYRKLPGIAAFFRQNTQLQLVG